MSDKRQQFHDQHYIHFVTFSCDQRRDLFEEDQPKRILLGQLNSQLSRLSAKWVGFVIMPDHVHAMLWLEETKNLSSFMQHWKRLSSHAIRNWYRIHRPVYFQKAQELKRIWIPKYYEFSIFSESKLIEKLEYMHLNPVRTGLVSKPSEWRWSSARWYEFNKSVGVPIHRVF
ncbi:transposase [uncultured Rubinisphaera sp.]|uniref:REP-associated tyrosine transposase n=1 Tax=uncultured Rubinisphaera sp. TaxID=1678686 RepID=UPI000ECBADB5|nr:hypothetical protein [Planctomycetaceae bacterium]|tara:strand:- start:53 stop:568 length:516 start_codon:yes stop_codon:yes gene_type:complete